MSKEVLPPHSIEAEQSVIGGLLISKEQKEALDQLNALGLTEQTFYRRDHQLIFSAVQKMLDAGTACDIITLSERLEQEKHLDAVGGLAYLGLLAKNTPSAANLIHYAGIVLERWIRRRIIAAGVDFAKAAQQPEGRSAEELLAQAQQKLETLHELSKPRQAPTIALNELLKKDYTPVRWAVPGLIPEGVSMLASKPKMGKSFMILNVCLAVGSGGKALNAVEVERGRALYISLEDTERRLKTRAQLLRAAADCDVEFAVHWRRLEDGGIKDIEAYLKKHPDTRLVVIDTLEKARSRKNKNNGDAYAEDSAIGFMLTELTKKHPGLALVVIHHLRKSDSEDPLDLVTGTMGLTGSVDGILILKRSRGQADAELYVTGKDIEEEGSYAMSFDALEPGGPKVHWSLLGKADEYRYTDSQQQIIDLIKDEGPQTIKEVAEKCEMYLESANAYQAAKKQLYRMMKDDLLRREGSRYVLIDYGTALKAPPVNQLQIKLEHIPDTTETEGVARGTLFHYGTRRGTGTAQAPHPITRWQAVQALSTLLGSAVGYAREVQPN